jgi:hypothetical protein
MHADLIQLSPCNGKSGVPVIAMMIPHPCCWPGSFLRHIEQTQPFFNSPSFHQCNRKMLGKLSATAQAMPDFQSFLESMYKLTYNHDN